jgi:hypothetical protein
MELFDFINIMGYPLVGYLAWKGGFYSGIETTISVLGERGLLELDDSADEL